MLTLPDTDTALDSLSEETVVLQQIRRSTPWADHSPAQANFAYRLTDKGPMAAELSEPDTDHPITPENFSAHTKSPILLDAPVLLNPLAIPKPWGQEIWFSGIEERGESTVSQGDTKLPLSAYLALAPQRLVRRAAPLLLKILDPNPTPETGCLYFETHNTKHEVYVVTHVDAAAWPKGKGAIRLGMDQKQRKKYKNDSEFRAAYLSAVQRYEEVRRKIDSAEVAGRASDKDKAYKETLSHEEQVRHADMDAFTALVPLGVSDVVQVAPHIPHSLQNGVRVFEFQTPTYERNIISFNQQVLTQNHWDSKYAVDHMSLDGPTPPTIETLDKTEDQLIERIVDFDDFEVLRAKLTPHHSTTADLTSGYLMLAMLEGELRIDSTAATQDLAAVSEDSAGHQAALIPASAQQTQLTAGATGATLLIARPKAHAADKIPTDASNQGSA